MAKKRPTSVTTPPDKPARRAQPVPSVFATPVLRVFLLAAASVAAAGYGIWRYYAHKPVPMLVPAPSASELPAPEVVPIER